MFRLPADLAEPVKGFTVEETILARTVLGEAGGESQQGKAGVANVVMNRVGMDLGGDGKPDWWGEGVIEVCLKPWQFTCWTDQNRARILFPVGRDKAALADCLDIARAAIAGRLPDLTSGAVQYLNVPLTKRLYGRLPDWVGRLRQTVIIGRHTFFAL